MKKYKRVVHKVECASNAEHVFEKVFNIEEGTENQESEIEAYCPFCDKYTTITVKGKVERDLIIRESGDSNNIA